VKLDISLIQRWPEVEQGAILTAVLGPRRTNGRIDTRRGCGDRTTPGTALALGATLGQGWYFARAGSPRRLSRHPQNLSSNSTGASSSAFSHSRRDSSGHAWPKGPSSRHFTTPGEPGLVLGNSSRVVSAFQSAERFYSGYRQAILTSRRTVSLVAALGVGRKSRPAPGVRDGLSPDDPVSGEWVVAVIGTHYLGALIAKDLGDDDSLQNESDAFVHRDARSRDGIGRSSRAFLESRSIRTVRIPSRP